MTAIRPTGASRTRSDCALLTGAPECRCAQDAASLDDDEILTRAIGMLRWEQRASGTAKAAVRCGLDALLDEARGRGPSSLVADLLRICLMVRLLGADPADAGEVEALLAEYIEIAELDGDQRRIGDAATLRAHRTAVFGQGENALADAAAAFAILTDITAPTQGEDPRRWARDLGRSLNGLVLVLLKLGAHELADEVSRRAVAVAEAGGSPLDRLVHQLNRVRLQLSWALRLERGGRDAAATTRFVGAAQTAQIAAQLWDPAMELNGGGGPALRECALIGAAYALQRPGPEHLDLVFGLREVAHFVEDRIVLAIATARCLLVAGRAADAVAQLRPLHEELRDRTSDAVLALALHREFARMDHLARGASGTSSLALEHYAQALEGELWALREARLTALRSQYENHRLARENGAVAAQAMQDPLTGLPNRRALDIFLTEATGTPSNQPCAVALVDLDRFKDVNDARSHAAGDAVLREVAGCLRTTLRAQDMVARYGGDEFVVVMPSTPLPVAAAALQRAADTVAALPTDVAAGVTVSVGVVRAPLEGEPSAALAAADAAMYRAKHAGGNMVVSAAGSSPARVR